MGEITIINCQQGSLDWHGYRLGRITSTTAAALMTKGRGGKTSETAMKEIYRLKAEKRLKTEYKKEKLQEYLDRTNINSKAMQFGKATEDEACGYYIGSTGIFMQSVGFVIPEWDDEIDLGKYWGDSPDGVYFDDETHKIMGVLEIKCPNSATWVKYADKFNNGETLKEIEPQYYWQVLNHIAVSGAEWCDFVIYDPMLKDGYKCVRINRAVVAEDISALIDTIKETIKTYLQQ